MGVSRREFLKYAGGTLGAVALAGPLAACANSGDAAGGGSSSLTAVTWGEPYVEVSKSIAAKWAEGSGTNVAWQLHQGGAETVLAKIEAQWPNVAFDLVAAWDPVFKSMIQEGWLEPIEADRIPNLADIPDALIMRDGQGRMVTVPMSVTGGFWGYRKDSVPRPLTSLSDLLEDDFRGQIAMPNPLAFSGAALVSLALERGGDEFNIEPGFDFVKELAEQGQIGRVIASDADTINSITSGETSVTFMIIPGWNEVAKNFETTIVNRAESPGARGFLWTEGWSILKGGETGAAFDLANSFVSPDNNTAYNEVLGSGTTNSKARPVAAAEPYLYQTPDEFEEFGYFPDYEHLSQHVEEWNTRWEKEVVPLL